MIQKIIAIPILALVVFLAVRITATLVSEAIRNAKADGTLDTLILGIVLAAIILLGAIAVKQFNS